LFVVAEAMSAMAEAGGSTTLMWLMLMGHQDMTEFAVASVMWIIMMVGMTVPSAAPILLLDVLIRRKEQTRGRVIPPAALFLTGYVAVWGLFRVAAAALQFGLTEVQLAIIADGQPERGIKRWCSHPFGRLPAHGLEARMPRALPLAGNFPDTQLARRKARTLDDSAVGVYRECCCWLAMCVLFVMGVMNLTWVAALGVLVLAEKLTPFGAAIDRVSDLLLLAGGALLAVRGL
jgi:predicted metal-binding membrane protein